MQVAIDQVPRQGDPAPRVRAFADNTRVTFLNQPGRTRTLWRCAVHVDQPCAHVAAVMDCLTARIVARLNQTEHHVLNRAHDPAKEAS